ncbi:uncharacterized protein [Apostichopus japonicus]|uniref:uncharacterized protein isoform X2 n=1 Tax=Stichopus japonicus TaxID=307972 RepID=UPI003AB8A25B
MDDTEENVEPSNQSDLSGVETPPSEERSVEGQQEDMGTDESNNTVTDGDENASKPLNYQHTKVYQDSDGRFVIEQATPDSKDEESTADSLEEKPPDKAGDANVEAGTEKKEQALRYLEAFASSVAEAMKIQAAQQSSDQIDTERSEQNVRERDADTVMKETECSTDVQGATHSNSTEDYCQENQQVDAMRTSAQEDGEEYERQDSTTDEAEHLEDVDTNIGTDEQQEQLVTVVVADDGAEQEKTEGDESSAVTTRKSDDKNTLRRSKRKRRSKKRGYEDDDNPRKKWKQNEKNINVKDEDDGEIEPEEEDFEMGESPSEVKTEDKLSSWTCKHCNKIFTTNTQYKQHLRTHSDQKPHQCIFCSKRFRQKCQKDKHERIHTGAKPYRCRHCDRAFSESGSRNRHERIHTGYKPYICQHCDKSFIQKGNKDAHEKIHTTFKPFKCLNENCNDTFASDDELKKHREGHPMKPYKCHYCCKGFPFNAERKRHERCHTGIKPYKCAYCDKTFTQKGNKDNHERTHTGDKPHCCSYCPKGFIRKQYLEKHMKKKHGKDLYQCNQPPAVYAVLELDPSLPKEGHLAAESLLQAAHIVAQHQVALQNGGDASSTNVETERLGQVMAEVNQQLSSIEHHVAIVQQDGVQHHQLQVVERRGELNQGESVAVMEGQIVEEHEVIGIQNQVVVAEPEITVSNEGQVVIQQHQFTDEEGNVSVVQHQLPAVETRLVSSGNHQVLQQTTQFVEDNQEFTTVEGQVVQGQFVNESVIVVRQQDDLENAESEGGTVSQEQVDGNAEQDDHQTEEKAMPQEQENGFGNEDDHQEDGYREETVQFNQEGKQLVIHGHNIVIQAPQDTQEG